MDPTSTFECTRTLPTSPKHDLPRERRGNHPNARFANKEDNTSWNGQMQGRWKLSNFLEIPKCRVRNHFFSIAGFAINTSDVYVDYVAEALE